MENAAPCGMNERVHACMCAFARAYAEEIMCVYVCMYVCMHACMHAWMDGWMDGWHVCKRRTCSTSLECRPVCVHVQHHLKTAHTAAVS